MSKVHYVFNRNVYIVNGKAKSCIYDLNESKHYSINRLLAEKMNMLNKGQICEKNVDQKFKIVLDKFIGKGLVKLSELPESRFLMK